MSHSVPADTLMIWLPELMMLRDPKAGVCGRCRGAGRLRERLRPERTATPMREDDSAMATWAPGMVWVDGDCPGCGGHGNTLARDICRRLGGQCA